MQPLTRSIPRLFSDSVYSSAAPRSFRISNRATLPSSARLQCDIRCQRRRFANDSKPINSNSLNTSDGVTNTTSATSSKPTDEPSYTGQQDDVVTHTLPSTADSRRSDLNHRFSHLMDHLQSNIFIASQRINDLTGYSGIESLKSQIQVLENGVQLAQEAVRSSRAHYKSVVASRAATQREVTTLLARKDSWTPIDLERFTSLYRMDHSNEQAVQEAAAKLADTEREAEVVAGKLSAAILGRYHEEQIWSDKIRRMSTWGTWGLMGVNVLLFLVFQFALEPWRRRRLVGGFEEKVLEALERERKQTSEGLESKYGVAPAEVDDIKTVDALIVDEGTEAAPEALMKESTVAPAQASHPEQPTTQTEIQHEQHPPRLDIRDPATWRLSLEDLFSSRLIQLRKQDVTTIALEGAATGAALTALIATLIFRSS